MTARRLYPSAVLALAALLAVLPLILIGYSCGHDFDFHLRSWMEAAAQWHTGILKPIWAFHAAWNTGEPRFLFYPPLSWTTGALLTTLLPWAAVSTTFTWLVLFLSGLTMHRLLFRWVSPNLALLGGCLYLANPYMLFCAYERTAYAELMAAAWMPLLLAALFRPRISVARIAFAVALLWITNAPAGIVGCYSVLILGTGRLLWLARTHRDQAVPYAARVIAGTALGLFADSFYLLPLAVERKYIQLNLAIVPIAQPYANFLYKFSNDEFHNGVTRHVSDIAVVLFAAAICGGALALIRRNSTHTFPSMHAAQAGAVQSAARQAAIPILVAYSVIVLLLHLPISTPVWRYAPQLIFLQFPWRFLAMQAAVTVTLVVLCLNAFTQRSLSKLAAALLGITFAVFAAFLLGNHIFRQGCDDSEGLAIQRRDFLNGIGYEETDEYTPWDADSDAIKIHLPPAWLSATATGIPSPLTGAPTPTTVLPHEDATRPNDLHLAVTGTPATRYLILRIRNFRGWHTLRDGSELAQLPHRADGLIAVPLPDGTHHVELIYRTTSDQYLGGGLSLLGLLILIATAQSERRRTASAA